MTKALVVYVVAFPVRESDPVAASEELSEVGWVSP
jgi:hypothetical protein